MFADKRIDWEHILPENLELKMSVKKADREPLFFYLSVGLLLVPIWIFPAFATQDGPVHIHNAELIRQLLVNPNAWFSDWISLNHRFDPTWPPHLILAGMLSVLPPGMTEKLFQSCIIIALPLAARYSLRGLGVGSETWAWLALPMAFSYPFHLGFYSFCLGLSFSMLMLGYWLRHGQNWAPRAVIIQALLALAAYFSHIFSMITFGIAMVPVALARLWQSWVNNGPAFAFKRQFLPWLLAFAPAVFLAVEFLFSRVHETYPVNFEWRFKALAQFSALQTYRDIEALPSIAIVVVLFVLSSVAAFGAIRDRRPLAIAWVGSMGLSFMMAILMPESRMVSENGMKGGAYLVPRIGMVFYLCSLFLIAAQFGRPRFQRFLITGTIVFTVAGIGLRWPVYLEINERLEEYRSAAQFVNSGDVIIALNIEEGSFLPGRRDVTAYSNPMRNEVDRIATERGAFSFNNWQASMGYFPTLYSERANPVRNLGNLQDEPPNVDIQGFEARLGRRVDVILMWMAESQRFDADPLIMQIENAGFQRDYVSEPHGRMWVYRRPSQEL